MGGEEDWWTNPWMILLFGVAAVPLMLGVGGLVLIVHSARRNGWDLRRGIALALAAAWTVWWALDWWGRATDSRFHS